MNVMVRKTAMVVVVDCFSTLPTNSNRFNSQLTDIVYKKKHIMLEIGMCSFNGL